MSRIGVIDVPWKLLGVPLSMSSELQLKQGDMKEHQDYAVISHLPFSPITCYTNPVIICALIHMHQGRYSNASTKINEKIGH